MSNKQIAAKIVSDFIAESERAQSLSIENIASFIEQELDKKDNTFSKAEMVLINIIADIRIATGVNERPMISELALAIKDKIDGEKRKCYIRGLNSGKFSR